jgi:hypothetical protein
LVTISNPCKVDPAEEHPMSRSLMKKARDARSLLSQGLPPRTVRQCRPQGETLEGRQVLSSVIATDMTSLAQCYAPRRDYATVLYLNFDGWQARGISPFQATDGSNLPDHRDRDIQDILFRTAQVFAPFNLKVLRMLGNGSYDSWDDFGSTTVFIGANQADMDQNGVKYVRSYTPWNYTDYPTRDRGLFHRPNSDSYDLAFVDPVGPSGSVSTSVIVQYIAHEAGHTFGLAHVLSFPDTDVMSYNSSNDYFIDTTYDITDLNFNAATGQTSHAPELVPTYSILGGWLTIPIPISHQNSYTYLETVLGPRPPDDFANVADPLVAANSGADFNNGFLPNLSPGQIVRGTVDPVGDHDVFNLTPATAEMVFVNVFPDTVGNPYPLDPTLLVYDVTDPGTLVLIKFNNDRTANDRSSFIQFPAEVGHSYRLVVGAEDARSWGGYSLRLDDASTVFAPKHVIWVGIGASLGGTSSRESSRAATAPLPATALDALWTPAAPSRTSTGTRKAPNRRSGLVVAKDRHAVVIAGSAKPSGPRRLTGPARPGSIRITNQDKRRPVVRMIVAAAGRRLGRSTAGWAGVAAGQISQLLCGQHPQPLLGLGERFGLGHGAGEARAPAQQVLVEPLHEQRC